MLIAFVSNSSQNVNSRQKCSFVANRSTYFTYFMFFKM